MGTMQFHPQHCRSKGGSDYCEMCGRDMGNRDMTKPCAYFDISHRVKSGQITAFGCSAEAEDIANGRAPAACKKWCGSSRCTYALKPKPDNSAIPQASTWAANTPKPIPEGGNPMCEGEPTHLKYPFARAPNPCIIPIRPACAVPVTSEGLPNAPIH